MEESNLILTLSGIRGRIEKDFKYDTIKKIAIAFGLLVNGKDKKIVIGRDTRPSGILIEEAIIEGLILSGFEIINFGICPTPVIIHAKNKLNIPFGIIITGSHNSQEWNGLKLISETTFLNTNDLQIVSIYLENIDLNDFKKPHYRLYS
jgi:phosphomannomutase